MKREPYNKYYYGYSPVSLITAFVLGITMMMPAIEFIKKETMWTGILTIVMIICFLGVLSSDEKVVRGKQ